jgi:hypothetical protein
MPSGLLGKLANKLNWNDKQRTLFNLAFEIITIIIFILLCLRISDSCNCVAGTITVREFNECFKNCFEIYKNKEYCINICLPTYNISNGITCLNLTCLNTT